MATYDGAGTLTIISDKFPMPPADGSAAGFPFVFFLEEAATISQETTVKVSIKGELTTLGILYLENIRT